MSSLARMALHHVIVLSATDIEKKIEAFLKTIKSMKEFSKVEFIIFYGSLAKGGGIKNSDMDICVYYRAKRKEDASRLRLKLLTKLCSDLYDIQIFQLLPLYVRVEVLKGKVLYVRNKRFLNEKALETIRDFELFKPYYHDYIYR